MSKLNFFTEPPPVVSGGYRKKTKRIKNKSKINKKNKSKKIKRTLMTYW
jgi:hypothetical protein